MKTAKLNHPLTIMFLHIVVVILAYLFCHALSKDYLIPDNGNLRHYDVAYYYSIKNIGYLYLYGRASNLAFFPMFPYVWGLTSLNILFMGVFNYLLFSASLYFLLKDSKLPGNFLLFILSFPSFLFFVIPYAEALFFFFCVILILGYKRNSDLLICIGLLGASTVRSTCIVFVPAIIICSLFEIYSFGLTRKRLISMLYQILSSLVGFFGASFWMSYYTHKWFYFVEVQKYWKRHWALPHFPLTTIEANRVLGLDAIAFTVACIALFFFVCVLIKVINKRFKLNSNLNLEKYILFSILFLIGVTILDTGFTNTLHGTTNIWSINRHIMCTAFSVIFIQFLYERYSPTCNELIGITLLILSCFFLTGVFHYLKPALFYILFFLVLFTLKNRFTINRFFILYYLFSVFLQITFYSDFLAYKWVG